MQTTIILAPVYIKKKHTSNNPCIVNYKSECPHWYKIAIIKNLLNYAKQISSFNEIFYNELKDIKQTLINSGFPNYLVNEQIKLMIKNEINDKLCYTKYL